MSLLRRLTDGIERSEGLDTIGGPGHDLAVERLRAGRLKDALSGTWLGHPVHPLMVAVPIGAWVSASLLDLTTGDTATAARRLIGFGVLAAVPTTMAGLSDWSDTTGAEQRVGTVHAGLNLAALVLYARSWAIRGRSDGSSAAGPLLALAGGALLGVAGYLGGHLSYALGVGIDTNAFETGPEHWEDVAPAAEVEDGQPHAVPAAGVSLLLVEQDGRLHALANRCSHRGAPLAEGEVGHGCITCPWHASRFDLDSGEVLRGPATQPQPVYSTRRTGERIEVRRVERRSLRTNSVGPA